MNGLARTFTPINMWDVRLNSGASADFKIAVGGPFVMNTREELDQAYASQRALLIGWRDSIGVTWQAAACKLPGAAGPIRGLVRALSDFC